MSEALVILRRHLEEAKRARDYHRQAGRRGNIEATVAGLKINWLKNLIGELENEPTRTPQAPPGR